MNHVAALIIAAVILYLLIMTARADDHTWTDNYVSPDGVPCCSHAEDCDTLNTSQVRVDYERRLYDIQWRGKWYTWPMTDILPSETPYPEVCGFDPSRAYPGNAQPFIRCVFLPVGG